MMYHGITKVESLSRAGPVREDELVRYDGVECGFEEKVFEWLFGARVDDLVKGAFPVISFVDGMVTCCCVVDGVVCGPLVVTVFDGIRGFFRCF